MANSGKLIVIDGSDGTGKTTQTALLLKKLQKLKYKVKLENFPQYGKKSAGPVEDYLNGVYGTAEELGAYIPSLFYAVDRFAASKRIKNLLDQGFIVISNRYVSSNMAHQGGKIKNASERIKYFSWLFDLEYNMFKIPKPDLTIILHVPAKISHKLINQRGPKYYIGAKKKDLHEKDFRHLVAAEKIYLEIAQKFHYPLIECAPKDQILPVEIINELILGKVRSYLP